MTEPDGTTTTAVRPRLVIVEGGGWREARTAILVTSGLPREFDYPPHGYSETHFTGFGRRLLHQLDKLADGGCDIMRILRFGVRYTVAHPFLLPWTEADDLVVAAFVEANGLRPFDVVRDSMRADGDLDLAGMR